MARDDRPVDRRLRATYRPAVNARKGLVGVLPVVLGIGGIVLLLCGGLAAIFFLSFDTQFAPGYSEKKFRAIRLGDSEQQVLATLGPPFSTEDTEPYQAWIYSDGNQRHFARDGEGRGTYTTFRFDSNECVVAVNGMVQTSPSSFEFGDGLNYLKLSGAQIESLKGTAAGEIKRRFGPPVAVYEYQATKMLCYSRSPSSANYHLRIIGVDQHGRVVRIWREIYWD